MKRSLTLVSFLLLFCLNVITVCAQQGVIKYKIDVDSDNQQIKSMMKDSKLTLTYKNGKSRADMDMGVSKNTSITDGDKTIILIDAMGMKYKMNVAAKDNPKNMKDDAYDVEYTNDTMTIAGYLCKKVNIKTKDGHKLSAYVTDAITATNGSFPFKKVKGFPLQFAMEQRGISFSSTATSVDLKSPVSDSTFVVDDKDYQELTADQIKQMSGGK